MLCSEDEVRSYLLKVAKPWIDEEETYEITNEVMRQLPSSLNEFSELNDILCNILSSLSHRKKGYDTVAALLLQKEHYSKTPHLFSEAMIKIQQNRDRLNTLKPLLNDDFFTFTLDHKQQIDEIYLDVISKTSPFTFTSFGWKTLLRSYLIRTHEGVIERPDHLWFRVSLFLHRDDWDSLRKSFELCRQGLFIHATPTLYHAGLKRSQMASCFLVGTDDSVNGIFKTIGDAAQISKWAGGIGIHITNIRSKNSYICGTNGVSNGIMPMLKVYNDTSRYIDQGGGKRNGAFAMYIEPWHPDIFDFICARRNIGSDEERARDLFYGLWIPDLFMKQVEAEEGDWYLISPSQAPELCNLWGDKFEEAYWRHVNNNNYEKKIKARELWLEICRSQIETGVPYMLYKDACNRKSNQQNLGTIRSSNLCCEIIEYSDHNEYAVCNLGSLALPRFIKNRVLEYKTMVIYTKASCSYCCLLKQILNERKYIYEDIEGSLPSEYSHLHTTYPLVLIDGKYVGGFNEMWDKYLIPEFDYDQFREVVHLMVKNLNRVIDLNAYPLEECKRSNLRHRPIGIGVQGLADVFYKMRLPYDSPKARELNRNIFEALYFYALSASVDIAKTEGPYSSFNGSPLSEGKFHFDLCDGFDYASHTSGRFDWEQLRRDVLIYGTRNSLLVAPMPTASTSQILGNTESFEPLTNNLYVRRTSAGEFYVCNEGLRSDMEALSRWDNDTIDHLIIHKGSVQQLNIPNYLKQLYRTVWEIPQKSLIDMAADRQLFIDQSQSFNIYLNEPLHDKLTKIHFYGWKKGLKTGSYYIRSRAAISSQNVTIDPTKEMGCESCSA